MTDYMFLYTPDQNVQVVANKGHLAGVIVTSTSATPAACSIYDYAGAGPPSEKIFEVMVNNAAPLVIFFNDRYAPRFQDGLWIILGNNAYATLWAHCPTT